MCIRDSYYIDPPRYTIDDCIERGLTYSVPLKAKLKLYCTDPDIDTTFQGDGIGLCTHFALMRAH